MLELIRNNSKSLIAKIIVGLIALTLALFGVESLVSLTKDSNSPVTVNGEEITSYELRQGIEVKRRQILATQEDKADLDDAVLVHLVLDGLIEQKVLLQAADEQGIVFPDFMLDQLLVNTPVFQVNGRFDKERFQSLLASIGFTALTYRDRVRQDKILEQLKAGYLLSSLVLDTEVKEARNLMTQTRDLSYFKLDSKKLAKTIKLNNEVLESYFADHKNNYKTEEQLVLDYLLLDKKQLVKQVKVAKSEIAERYKQLKDQAASQEQRQAAHILVEVNDKQDEASAKIKIDALAKRLAKGEKFAALAKEASEDIGTAATGGDLGYNSRGAFSPAFDKRLFALSKGQVSEPILTEFGYHLIKLKAIKAKKVASLSSMQAKLKKELLAEKAQALYLEQLAELADISFAAADLSEPAETLGLKIKSTKVFDRFGGKQAFTRDSRVLQAAFSKELIAEGLNSTPVELNAEQAVVFRVKKHMPIRLLSFAEAKKQLAKDYKQAELERRLNTQSLEIVNALEQGKSLSSQASKAKIIKRKAVKRNEKKLDQAIVQQLFKMPKPKSNKQYAAVRLADNSRAILALTAVQEPKVQSSNTAGYQQMKMMLAAQLGRYEYSALIADLKAKANIKRR